MKFEAFMGSLPFIADSSRGLVPLCPPITGYIKQGEFVRTKAATKAFNEVKQKMTEAPLMRLPDFTNPFEVECDASGMV